MENLFQTSVLMLLLERDDLQERILCLIKTAVDMLETKQLNGAMSTAL